jgi:hypothetical protein
MEAHAWDKGQAVFHHAWVQIHDIPELYRKKPLLSNAAANVGEVISVELKVDGGDFVRVRVWLDVRKELTRFVTIRPEGEAPVVMRVKYEKVPRFCAVCGRLGHVQEECGSGVHSPGKIAFGKWMLADTAWNRAQLHSQEEGFQREPSNWNMPASRGMGRGSHMEGRGGERGQENFGRGHARGRGQGLDGRGRGNTVTTLGTMDNRKRSSSDAHLTEVSPNKEQPIPARAPMLEWKEAGVIIEKEVAGAQKKLDFDGEKEERVYPPRSGTPPPPLSGREQKRPKKQTTPKRNRNTAESAGSKEHRQEQ